MNSEWNQKHRQNNSISHQHFSLNQLLEPILPLCIFLFNLEFVQVLVSVTGLAVNTEKALLSPLKLMSSVLARSFPWFLKLLSNPPEKVGWRDLNSGMLLSDLKTVNFWTVRTFWLWLSFWVWLLGFLEIFWLILWLVFWTVSCNFFWFLKEVLDFTLTPESLPVKLAVLLRTKSFSGTLSAFSSVSLSFWAIFACLALCRRRKFLCFFWAFSYKASFNSRFSLLSSSHSAFGKSVLHLAKKSGPRRAEVDSTLTWDSRNSGAHLNMSIALYFLMLDSLVPVDGNSVMILVDSMVVVQRFLFCSIRSKVYFKNLNFLLRFFFESGCCLVKA